MTHNDDTKAYEKATFPIRISPKVRDELKRVGIMHETYDDVIKRLLFKKNNPLEERDKETEDAIEKRL